MEKVLGQFLTEVGDVENVMFETILAVAKKDPNEIHKEFYSVTMSPKVVLLQQAIQHGAFDDYRDGVNHLLAMLRALVDRRNNIVHGETFHVTRRGETKSFRVGFTRKNTAPWKDFDFEGNGANIFTADQIGDVVFDCIAIKTDLDLIRQKVIEKLTGKKPPYLSHSFEID